MVCRLKLTRGGHTLKVLRRNRLCRVARSTATCLPSFLLICAPTSHAAVSAPHHTKRSHERIWHSPGEALVRSGCAACWCAGFAFVRVQTQKKAVTLHLDTGCTCSPQPHDAQQYPALGWTSGAHIVGEGQVRHVALVLHVEVHA